jgi:hypothetical protein
MNALDPWAFGWTQLLTLIGFAITVLIAVAGFRTFNRWKREKLEQKRIETAFEALSIAYEAKFVFDNIRNPLANAYEWEDMPRVAGENEDDHRNRGTFYAILKRIDRNKDFFERLWKLQPRFMAVFGSKTEEIFFKLHQSQNFIRVSAQMLAHRRDEPRGQWNENRQRQRDQWEADVWIGFDAIDLGIDRVGRGIADFKAGIEKLCLPVTERNYKTK